MIQVKKYLESILDQAASRAFPINDKCKVEKQSTPCDYHSDLPKHLFSKYKTGIHTFGMFNEREIADSIFANCQKNDVIRAVQVSGLGTLQLFLSEKFISHTFNKLISDQQVSIKKTQAHHNLLLHIINTVEESHTLAYYKTELLINSLIQANLIFGTRCEHRKILVNNKGPVANSELLQSESLHVADVPLYSDIKSWIQEFSLALGEGNKFDSVVYLFNWFNCEIFLKSQTLPTAFSVCPYGSIFMGLGGGQSSEVMTGNEEILRKTWDQGGIREVFHYNLIKVPRSSCELIAVGDGEKRVNSFWSAFSVYRQLRVDGEVELIKEEEVQGGLRMILLHAIDLPDVLSACIQNCSMHYLIIWIEKYSELYINTHSHLSPTSLNTLNFLSKLLLSYTLPLIHIDPKNSFP